MKTFKIILPVIVYLFSLIAAGQESGNVNYGPNRYNAQQQPMENITGGSENEMTFTIRGIYNEKPSLYAATFSLMQVGESQQEIDQLLNERIDAIVAGIKKLDTSIEVVTDMISFVPVYQYEQSNRLFSRKTYNEVPAGYQMKKNLIIKYKTRILDRIVSICAGQEVYDLVKVDYIITNLDAIQAKLQAKTLEEYKAKLAYYAQLKGASLEQKEKSITENFNIVYPVESYNRYTAFSRAQMPHQRNRPDINPAMKTETLYYNPVMAKSHTFVINPEITEPCVQVFYDLSVTIKLKDDKKPAEPKNYLIITSTGDVRPLTLN